MSLVISDKKIYRSQSGGDSYHQTSAEALVAVVTVHSSDRILLDFTVFHLSLSAGVFFVRQFPREEMDYVTRTVWLSVLPRKDKEEEMRHPGFHGNIMHF